MLVFLLALHILAALFWVGGMAFAYWVLRPAAGPLEPAMRLPLWRRVFGIFLPWVGVSIAVLLGTGYAILVWYFGGFASAPIYVNVMHNRCQNARSSLLWACLASSRHSSILARKKSSVLCIAKPPFGSIMLTNAKRT
jgi:uncharacterized membrane protein